MNKVAIITGASKGIGREVAIYFGSNKYDLLLIARTKSELLSLKQEINSKNISCDIHILAVDMTNFALLSIGVENFLKEKNRIDVLFNNAGYAERGTSSIIREELLNMINTNLIAAIDMITLVVPYMKNQRSGWIINLGSRSGKIARPVLGGYSASKFGLLGFNEALYKELVDYNIKVTAICPGYVATRMTNNIKAIPKDEMVQTKDIVKTIDYLMSLSKHVIVKEIMIECNGLLHMSDNLSGDHK